MDSSEERIEREVADCFRVELISVVLYVMIDIRFGRTFCFRGGRYKLDSALFARFGGAEDHPSRLSFSDLSFNPVNLLFQPPPV